MADMIQIIRLSLPISYSLLLLYHLLILVLLHGFKVRMKDPTFLWRMLTFLAMHADLRTEG